MFQILNRYSNKPKVRNEIKQFPRVSSGRRMGPFPALGEKCGPWQFTIRVDHGRKRLNRLKRTEVDISNKKFHSAHLLSGMERRDVMTHMNASTFFVCMGHKKLWFSSLCWWWVQGWTMKKRYEMKESTFRSLSLLRSTCLARRIHKIYMKQHSMKFYGQIWKKMYLTCWMLFQIWILLETHRKSEQNAANVSFQITGTKAWNS